MNENHPIQGLMKTAMDSIKDMIDVDTIIGNPIKPSSNTTIIPISKVCFGFAAGGSEFNCGTVNEHRKKDKEEEIKYQLPFGGGSGAGVTISPIAFVVVTEDNVRILPVDHFSSIDKLVDYVPDLIKQINCPKNKKETFKNDDTIKENPTNDINLEDE